MMNPFDAPVELDPPKDETFTKEELSKYDGVKSDKIYLGVKRVVFDVTKNAKVYGPGGSYSVFVGKDSSRALGKSSLEPADNSHDISYKYDDLSDSEMAVLDEWFIFFKNRYNIMGKVVV